MPDVELSAHGRDMLVEGNSAQEWVWRTVNSPDRKRPGDDGNMHYTKAIRERGGQVQHIVVNPDVQPSHIVTAFFDRRMGTKGKGI